MGEVCCQYTQDMAMTRPKPKGEEEVSGRVQFREGTRQPWPVSMKKLLYGVSIVDQCTQKMPGRHAWLSAQLCIKALGSLQPRAM